MSARRPTARLLVPFLTMPDHAGRAEAAVDRDAPFGELARDHVGGADFFEAEFGVGVEVTSDGGDAGRLRDERIDEFHGRSQNARSIH